MAQEAAGRASAEGAGVSCLAECDRCTSVKGVRIGQAMLHMLLVLSVRSVKILGDLECPEDRLVESMATLVQGCWAALLVHPDRC